MSKAALLPIEVLRAIPADAGRRRRTRDRICQTARVMFLEQGFGATTMEQIALGAEIGRSTLYTHFRDKEEILVAIGQDYLAAVAPIIASLPVPNPSRADIDRWIQDFADFVLEERVSSLLMIQFAIGKNSPEAMVSFNERVMQLYAEKMPTFRRALDPLNVLAWAQASAALRELSWALIHYVDENGSTRAMAMLRVAGDLFEKLIGGWDPQDR